MSSLRNVRLGVVFVSFLAFTGLVAGGGCAQSNSPGKGGTGGTGGSGGGGNNPGHCAGSPPPCAGLDDFDCATTAGCEHTGKCAGTALDCASLSVTGCAKQPGCTPSIGTCSGSAQQCFNFGNPGQCSQQQGCFWDANNFFCSGNATGCFSVPAESCSSQQGCFLSQPNGCSGNPTACDTLMAKNTCEKEIGCSWISLCSGVATACNAFSDADCPYQPGCTCSGCGTTSSSSSTGGGTVCTDQTDCSPKQNPCRTGNCINGSCDLVPNCKACIKQVQCNPKEDACLTGNCIDARCEALPNCHSCSDATDCGKAADKCFSGNCVDGKCELITKCMAGDGCCPPGCAGMGDFDCP